MAKSEESSRESGGAATRFHIAIFDDHLRSLELAEGTLLVGRSRHNQITLHDGLLSRKHCSLTCSGGRLILVDLNSSNGTYVNGQRIETRELGKDDIIELGKTVLVIFDGNSWDRGEGLMNLRNPVKAQELIQRIREGSVKPVELRPTGKQPRDGIRARKGLADSEHAFLRWLESSESPMLPGLVADYLTHKLVSLLVRNSKHVRSAFTSVLEDMMDPNLFQGLSHPAELRETIGEMVEGELRALRAAGVELDDDPESEDRGLLDEDEGTGS